MILASIRPTGRLALLAIPRDLYVVIPRRGYERINTAHFYAEAWTGQPGMVHAEHLLHPEGFSTEGHHAKQGYGVGGVPRGSWSTGVSRYLSPSSMSMMGMSS